ncbi:hypothetical protein L9F63_008807, partial [Diploptera punctata]
IHCSLSMAILVLTPSRLFLVCMPHIIVASCAYFAMSFVMNLALTSELMSGLQATFVIWLCEAVFIHVI